MRLSDVDSFGGIDADADALLDECFQDHSAYLDAFSHRKHLILGRKGSGKTAIYRKIIRTHDPSVFAFGHTFSDYPWHHHQLQALVGVPEELRYTHSWLYLILLTLAKVLLNHDASQPWDETALDALDRLEKFVVDSYGSRDPDLTQLFTPTKRLRIRPHFKLAKEWIDFGLDLERLPVSDLPRVVTEVNQKVTEAVLASLNPKHKYFICFDELDRGFDPTARTYTDMLIGLVLAAKLLNERARDSERQFSVVIFLRDDIYEVLRFEDKNKVTEALASVIAWDLPGEEWTLRRLMERRFIKVLGEGTDVAWSEVFDEDHQMPGRQTKYRHILDRTFNRPRDIIKFCNEVLKRYRARSGDGKFENRDVLEARSAYSDYLLRELGDEAHKHWPQYQECLEVLRAVGTAVFSHEELTKACVKRPGLLPDGIAPIEALRRLFDFSVVAYQKAGGAGGGSAYVWRYLDQRARFDESATYFRVHPGLIEALGLKRYSHKAGEDEEADAG